MRTHPRPVALVQTLSTTTRDEDLRLYAIYGKSWGNFISVDKLLSAGTCKGRVHLGGSGFRH